MSTLRSEQLQCEGGEPLSHGCEEDKLCPQGCRCDGSQVDCSHWGLTEIPSGIPTTTTHLILAENSIRTVNRAMFKGLNNLKSLSLFGNEISCVTPGAFDELASLTSLNLISNPFNCNCHMAWFADWLRRKDLTVSGPRCSKPAHLKNQAIATLATHEFRCSNGNDA